MLQDDPRRRQLEDTANLRIAYSRGNEQDWHKGVIAAQFFQKPQAVLVAQIVIKENDIGQLRLHETKSLSGRGAASNHNEALLIGQQALDAFQKESVVIHNQNSDLVCQSDPLQFLQAFRLN